MRKFIITAELRDLENQVSSEEISYSRMVELLNEKADKWYEDKVQEINRADLSSTLLHISFAKIDFNCPYCDRIYFDSEDKYIERCNKNKDYCTRIVCDCGNRFGMTYNMLGKAVSFKLDEKQIK